MRARSDIEQAASPYAYNEFTTNPEAHSALMLRLCLEVLLDIRDQLAEKGPTVVEQVAKALREGALSSSLWVVPVDTKGQTGGKI